MSRWDALKPTSQEGQARSGAPSRRSSGRRAARDGENVKINNRPPPSTKIGDAAVLRTSASSRRVRSTRAECMAQYEAFHNQIQHQRRLGKSWHEVDREVISSVARHIAENIDVLPAEQVANDSLLGAFLPFMMDDRSDVDAYCSCCSSICSMMRNQPFTLAVLAPTLNEINDDGGECLSMNPIRRRMFSVLQKALLSFSLDDAQRPSSTTQKVLWSCRAMSAAFQASKEVDGNHRSTFNTKDVSATAVSAFVASVLLQHETPGERSESELLNEALKLLNVFLHRHPDCSTHFASLMLSATSTTTRRTFDCCSVDKPSTMIFLLHQGNSTARLCANELILHLPLASWLQRDSHTSLLQSTLSFPCRTESSLHNLILATDCLLSRNRGHADEGVLALAATLLERNPIDVAPALTPSLLNLMNTVAHVTEQAFQTADSTRALEMLLQLAGGHATPEGVTTDMCIAMRIWLDSGSGHSFILRCLSSMKQAELGRSSSVHRAVRAILRSHPQLVVVNPTLWSAFCSTYDNFFAKDELVAAAEGMALFEGIVQGRHRAVVDRGEDFWRIPLEPLSLHLIEILAGGSTASKAVATAALSQLLPQDWVEIGSQDGVRYLGTVATLACDGSATARSEIYKALGNMYSNFYHPVRTACIPSSSAKAEETLVYELVHVTLDGCVDASPAVRCMALFGLGNLCQALCLGSAALALVGDAEVDRMASCACQHLIDEDVKVKGNAIRSAAHALCLVHRTAPAEPLGEHRTGFFCNAFAALARQSQATLALLDPERLSSLTWKERQALKKLGWGCFNAMSRMFDDGIGQRKELTESIAEVLASLMECVSFLSDLPEKVALAAGACLRSALANGCASAARTAKGFEDRASVGIGSCAWTCVSILLIPGRSEQSFATGAAARLQNSQKLHSEAEMLLKVLLECCTTADATLVVRQLQNSESSTSLRWLCDWMDSHGCSTEAFASFAIALDATANWSVVDPELEARFAVRAMAIRFDGVEADEM